MSLARMVYLSALLAGWAAFCGWLACEFLFLRGEGAAWKAVAAASLVGSAIGAGVSGAAGLSEGRRVLLRAGHGLLGGFAGGLAGGLAGQSLYGIGLPRALGWAIMGVGIGATDGLIQRSAIKLRNGLIGGAIGGLVGGLLFDLVSTLLDTGTGMASRAAAFVAVGLSTGVLVGLAQLVLRGAWLTVVDGFRTGRQLILTRPVTTLGQSELAHLPFLGPFGKPLEAEHARIERRADGRFVLIDNDTATGTRVNNRPVAGAVVLRDGDIIKLGPNYIRFNEAARRKEQDGPSPAVPRVLGEVPSVLDEEPSTAPQPVAPRPPARLPQPAAAPPPLPRPRAPTPAPTAAKPSNPDACPYCRSARGHPGPRGERYCMVHDRTY
jgi:hypothetical protein